MVQALGYAQKTVTGVTVRAAFSETLDRPIEQVFISTAALAYSYQNAESGELYGAEFSFRKGLSFLAPALEGFTLGGNLALIESEVRVRTGGIFQPTNLERELEGQSNYTVNASLSYQDPEGGTEADVSFNVFGERITAAGGEGIPDIKEQPRPTLDFTFKQPLWRSLELKLKAEDILDPEYEWTESANGTTPSDTTSIDVPATPQLNNLLADPGIPDAAFSIGSRSSPPNVIPSSAPSDFTTTASSGPASAHHTRRGRAPSGRGHRRPTFLAPCASASPAKSL